MAGGTGDVAFRMAGAEPRSPFPTSIRTCSPSAWNAPKPRPDGLSWKEENAES